MADRNVTVRLRAVISDYQNAMRTASAETSAFARLTSGQFKSMGSSLSDLGGDLTRKVSLPLAGLSVAGVKVAADFEQAFARMVGLAGVPAAEVDQLRESVLSLAGETGRAPQELADGLYFAASAGYDSATAMDIVEQAAKGAAAGLGTTAQVVDAVTSAMGAYGQGNISAAEATDVLTAAARVAKIEASQLAPQLGRLLPTANQLGVGFDEVAGAMAFLSQSSGNAELSATQLDSVLRKLNVQSEQGKKVLEEMGTSSEELHAAISRDGLLGALELLESKGFRGNSDALTKLFDDIQAYQGAVLLLEDSNGNLQETLDATANSTGALGEAFQAWYGTDAAEMQRGLADLTATLIEFGTAIQPLASDLVSLASTAAGFFNAMPDWLQKATLLFGVFGGPTLKALGLVLEHFDTIRKVGSTALDRIATGAYSAAGNLQALGIAAGIAGIAVAGIAMAWMDNAREAAEAEARVQGYTDAIREAGDVVTGVTNRLGDMAEAGDISNEVLEAMADAGVHIDDLADAAVTGGTALDDLRRRMLAAFTRENIDPQTERDIRSLGYTTDELIEAVLRGKDVWPRFASSGTHAAQDFARELLQLDGAIKLTNEDVAKAAERSGLLASVTNETTDAVRDQNAAFEEQATAAELAEEGIRNLLDATLAAFNAQLGYEQQTYQTAEAIRKMDEAAFAAWVTVDDGKTSVDEAKVAQDEYAQAVRRAAEEALRQADAAAKLAEDQAKAEGRTWTAADAATFQAGELQKVADTLAPDSALRARLQGYIDELNGIPSRVSTTVELRAYLNQAALAVDYDVGARAKGGPVYPFGTYLVGEEGPEILRMGATGGYVLPNSSLVAASSLVGPQPNAGATTVEKHHHWHVQVTTLDQPSGTDLIRRAELVSGFY